MPKNSKKTEKNKETPRKKGENFEVEENKLDLELEPKKKKETEISLEVEKLKIPEKVEIEKEKIAPPPPPKKEEKKKEEKPSVISPLPPPVSLEEKSETLLAIEKILEEDLGEVYSALPDYLKPGFRKKGEETAFKIDNLLKSVKVKIKEIINLIREWLKIVPGINRFFMEKEAKIKAEKILNWAKKK